MELAIEACGSEIQLAQRLGISEVSAATSSFGRWRRGDNKPDYDTTMKLLDAAGLIMLPEERDDLRLAFRAILELDPTKQVEALRDLEHALQSRRLSPPPPEGM